MEHSVALVDDHHLMRDSLAHTINGIAGYTVVLQAANGKELVDALQQTTGPAIAIVDLNMPVMDGYETIAWLKQHAPEVRALALTFDPADDAMIRAVRAGARGFLRKDARPNALKIALDAIMQTGYYYTDDMHRAALSKDGLHTRKERDRAEVLEQITPREMEFLMHVCSEDEPTYEQIAAIMGVHRRTVDNFRISLFEKFQIKSKTGLVLFAVRWGLIK